MIRHTSIQDSILIRVRTQNTKHSTSSWLRSLQNRPQDHFGDTRPPAFANALFKLLSGQLRQITSAAGTVKVCIERIGVQP